MLLNPIQEIIDNEGGYVNNPADRGGPTKYGITQKTLSNYWGIQATEQQVKDLDIKVAKEIYETNYLSKPRIDKLPEGLLQTLVLDMAVNHGPKRGIRILQNATNKTGLNSRLKPDGILGPKSRASIYKCLEYLGYYYTNLICKQRDLFYYRIVRARPSQEEFINGWLTRSNSFKKKLPDLT
jgi:lysozyme family protein